MLAQTIVINVYVGADMKTQLAELETAVNAVVSIIAEHASDEAKVTEITKKLTDAMGTAPATPPAGTGTGPQ